MSVEATALHTQETRAAFRELAPEQSITTTSCSGALLLPGEAAGAALLVLSGLAKLGIALLPLQLSLPCCEGLQSCRRSATPISMCVTVALANASAVAPRHSVTACPSEMRSTGLPLASVPCQLTRWP